MRTLIIGGTSGLGLELAKLISESGEVYITGRSDPELTQAKFLYLDLKSTVNLAEELERVADEAGTIDTLIYAAGFFQEGTITDLSEQQIDDMLSVGITAVIKLTKIILEKQGELSEFVAITSTSQWTPRLYEPVYTAAKAALGAYANSLSLDERVKRTLVAGPAGMATKFWDNTDETLHDTSKMLDPQWVAKQIQEARSGDYQYRFVRILREPARVENVEER